MTHNIFHGEKVRLRAIEPRDWEAFHAFDQDTELARHSYAIPFPRSSEEARRWAEEKAAAKPANDEFFWVIENDEGEVVGSINSHHCDRRNGTFQYGITIGRRHWRKGYASEAIILLLRFFFWERRYQKVNASIFAFNERSLRLHEKLGFQQEGRLRRMIFTNGAYHDEVVVGMTAEEFEASRGGSSPCST